jgi:hypothetical protein
MAAAILPAPRNAIRWLGREESGRREEAGSADVGTAEIGSDFIGAGGVYVNIPIL